MEVGAEAAKRWKAEHAAESLQAEEADSADDAVEAEEAGSAEEAVECDDDAVEAEEAESADDVDVVEAEEAGSAEEEVDLRMAEYADDEAVVEGEGDEAYAEMVEVESADEAVGDGEEYADTSEAPRASKAVRAVFQKRTDAIASNAWKQPQDPNVKTTGWLASQVSRIEALLFEEGLVTLQRRPNTDEDNVIVDLVYLSSKLQYDQVEQELDASIADNPNIDVELMQDPASGKRVTLDC